MNGDRNQPKAARRLLLGGVFIVATLLSGALAPHANGAHAAGRAADVPAPVAVTYHFAAQVIHGASSGWAATGQLSGTMDYKSGIVGTITLTTGITATVTGALTNTTSLAPTSLKLKSKGWAMTLDGQAINGKSGQFGGAIGMGGSSGLGSWVLIPETVHIGFDIGGQSAKGSAHKVSIGGALSMSATADGWADGTFTLLTNGKIVPAEGRMVNGNLVATLHIAGGDVVVVGASSPFLQLSKWAGTFIGPAKGDIGSWSGEG
jgi:hypothetical protein